MYGSIKKGCGESNTEKNIVTGFWKCSFWLFNPHILSENGTHIVKWDTRLLTQKEVLKTYYALCINYKQKGPAVVKVKCASVDTKHGIKFTRQDVGNKIQDLAEHRSPEQLEREKYVISSANGEDINGEKRQELFQKVQLSKAIDRSRRYDNPCSRLPRSGSVSWPQERIDRERNRRTNIPRVMYKPLPVRKIPKRWVCERLIILLFQWKFGNKKAVDVEKQLTF